MHDLDAAAAAPAPLAAAPRVLEIRFTGSGSEYFRIWAVNLLLILVTLGLYLPFAKARRIRYFYANTHIDGQALSFHGDPWKMFRGFLLLALLMLVIGGTQQLLPVLSDAGAVALMLLWPPLWRAGMRFRLSHTSWRGLRFGFAGDVAGAYKVFLPLSLPFAVLVLIPADAGTGLHILAGLCALAFNFMLPWTIGLAKRYQHNHYRYAGQQTHTWLQPSQVYGLSFRAGFIGGLAIVVAGIVAAALVPKFGVASWVPLALVYLLASAWISSAFTAGLQNMVWSKTASEALRFGSQLDTWALTRLNVKNWLLVVVTLGLYRPFAAVATTRLRLDALQLQVLGDLDSWSGAQRGDAESAAGDFAGDFFGIDMGL